MDNCAVQNMSAPWHTATRRELQALAKQAGIKANLKSEAIIAQLEALEHQRQDGPVPEGGDPSAAQGSTDGTESDGELSLSKRRKTWERPPPEALFSPRRRGQIRTFSFPVFQQPDSEDEAEGETAAKGETAAPLPSSEPDDRGDDAGTVSESALGEAVAQAPEAGSSPSGVGIRLELPFSSNAAVNAAVTTVDALALAADESGASVGKDLAAPAVNAENSTTLRPDVVAAAAVTSPNPDVLAPSPFAPSPFVQAAIAASPRDFYEQMQNHVAGIMGSPAMRHDAIRRSVEGLSRRLARAVAGTAPSAAADPSAADPSIADPSVADPSAADPTVADPSVAEAMRAKADEMTAEPPAKHSGSDSPAPSESVQRWPSIPQSLGRPSPRVLSKKSVASSPRGVKALGPASNRSLASSPSGIKARGPASGQGISKKHRSSPAVAAARAKAHRAPLSDEQQLLSPRKQLSSPAVQPTWRF